MDDFHSSGSRCVRRFCLAAGVGRHGLRFVRLALLEFVCALRTEALAAKALAMFDFLF